MPDKDDSQGTDFMREVLNPFKEEIEKLWSTATSHRWKVDKEDRISREQHKAPEAESDKTATEAQDPEGLAQPEG